MPGKESIKYIQQYSDEHLIYEVFYNAKLSDANLRKSNQPFYEAVLDEIGNRNLSSIKQLEWIRMRSSLSNYQIGKTFEQLVELGGTPDKIDRNNDTILSVTYTDYFNFIDESNRTYGGQILYYSETKHCFRNGKVISYSNKYNIGGAYGSYNGKGCSI